MKKIPKDMYIHSLMMKNEYFKDILLEEVKNEQFVRNGMHAVWAGLLVCTHNKVFDLLISKGIYPNENSHIVEQIFFQYNCFKKRRSDLEKKMNFCLSVLEKTKSGCESIVADIERHFKGYGHVIIDESVYPFIEKIYMTYAKDPNKIYYFEAANQLKFYNTFPLSIFDYESFKNKAPKLLANLIGTPYFERIKRLKLNKPNDQEKWIDFCEKYKQTLSFEKKFPQKQHVVKLNKI